MVPKILTLSDELLAIILAYVMVYEPAARTGFPNCFCYPPGLITGRLSLSLRSLLRPMRCHRRLYVIAKEQFLQANVVFLHLSELETSAMSLETPSMRRRNPRFLLEALNHAQLQVSISDMRAPFTRPFLSGDKVALYRETEGLKQLPVLCPNLQTAHFFLKIDEWHLFKSGPDLRRTPGRERTETEKRYRGHLESLVALFAKQRRIRVVTVAFHHWNMDSEILDMSYRDSEEVIDRLLLDSPDATWYGPTARIR